MWKKQGNSQGYFFHLICRPGGFKKEVRAYLRQKEFLKKFERPWLG